MRDSQPAAAQRDSDWLVIRRFSLSLITAMALSAVLAGCGSAGDGAPAVSPAATPSPSPSSARSLAATGPSADGRTASGGSSAAGQAAAEIEAAVGQAQAELDALDQDLKQDPNQD